MEEKFDPLKPKASLEVPRYAKLVLHGPTGVGKTTLACSIVAPGEKGLLMPLDSDHDVLTKEIHKHVGAHTDVLPITSVVQFKRIAKRIKERHPDFTGYDTYVLDPVSGFVDMMLGEMLLGVDYGGRSARDKPVGKTPEGRELIKELQLATTTWDDFHLIKLIVNQICKDLIDTPANVILTSHSRTTGEGSPVKGLVRPDLPEAAAAILARKSNGIGYVKANGSKRTVDFETKARLEAKSRIEGLDGIVDVNDIPAIINKWRGF